MNKHEWYERVMQAGLTSAAERTAFAIWKHHNHKSGDAWASIDTMAETIDRSTKTVRRGISELTDSGWLTAQEDANGRTRFYASHEGDRIVQEAASSGQDCPHERTTLSTPPIIEPIDSNPTGRGGSFEEEVSTKWPTKTSKGGRRKRPGMHHLESLKNAFGADAELCLREVRRQANATKFARTNYLVDEVLKIAPNVMHEQRQKTMAERNRRPADFGLAPELREVA